MVSLNLDLIEKLLELEYDVEKIDKEAFSGCSNLKLIEGIESLLELGARAFFGCKELSFPINELSKIKKIGDFAFANSGVQELYNKAMSQAQDREGLDRDVHIVVKVNKVNKE